MAASWWRSLEPVQETLQPEPPPAELRIAYEDEHLLVVDKPAGVVVHPGAGNRSGTLASALLAYGAEGGDRERPGIVHRLDRDTSGLLVVARSEEAYRKLQRLVRRRELEREYTALVRGSPRSWSGRIDAPIGRDRREPTRQSLDTEKPRDAVTHFTVIELLDPVRAPARPARDGKNASDSRSSGGDRAAGRRRPDVRGRRLSASGASSSTRPGSPSRTRSRASAMDVDVAAPCGACRGAFASIQRLGNRPGGRVVRVVPAVLAGSLTSPPAQFVKTTKGAFPCPSSR